MELMSRNVSGAQRELLKYYASVTSNRWLMLKIFGVLIIFVSHPRLVGMIDIHMYIMLMIVPGIHPCIVIVMYTITLNDHRSDARISPSARWYVVPSR